MEDPTKSATHGWDGFTKEPVRLGGTDSMGGEIGWIDPEDGLPWKSFYEFAHATTWGHIDSTGCDVEAHIAQFCAKYRCPELHDMLVTDALEAIAWWKALRRKLQP
jgi:hypothetical protein